MPKRTYQPKTKRRARRHGFLARMAKKKSGKLPQVVRSRRKKGRKLLAVKTANGK